MKWTAPADPDNIVAGDSLYSRGVQCFGEGKLEESKRLFESYLDAIGRSDLLKDHVTDDCPNEEDYATFEPLFRDFLTRKRLSWETGNSPLPPFVRDSAASMADRTDPSATKVFFIFPQYIYNNDRHIECDINDHLYESAVNAGIRAEYFFGDRILYPHLGLDPAHPKEDLAKLRERIREMRPDVIVFDANFVGDDIGLNAAFLRMLKKEFGPKLIGFMGDVWARHWIKIANYWNSVADMIVYIVPEGPFLKASTSSDKMLSTPYPVNSRNFFPDPVKNLDLSFFGSYAYLRPFWLTHALRAAARLGLKTNIREHERTSDCPTVAEYAEILRRSRMVMNFSSRSAQAKIITGRVWQALNSGALLLEEENEQTRYFFVPFVHYAPFGNARQLGHFIEFFHKNPDQADLMGRSALVFCQEHYGAAAIWKRILGAPQMQASVGS